MHELSTSIENAVDRIQRLEGCIPVDPDVESIKANIESLFVTSQQTSDSTTAMMHRLAMVEQGLDTKSISARVASAETRLGALASRIGDFVTLQHECEAAHASKEDVQQHIKELENHIITVLPSQFKARIADLEDRIKVLETAGHRTVTSGVGVQMAPQQITAQLANSIRYPSAADAKNNSEEERASKKKKQEDDHREREVEPFERQKRADHQRIKAEREIAYRGKTYASKQLPSLSGKAAAESTALQELGQLLKPAQDEIPLLTLDKESKMQPQKPARKNPVPQFPSGVSLDTDELPDCLPKRHGSPRLVKPVVQKQSPVVEKALARQAAKGRRFSPSPTAEDAEQHLDRDPVRDRMRARRMPMSMKSHGPAVRPFPKDSFDKSREICDECDIFLPYHLDSCSKFKSRGATTML